jgi:acyl-coenzyme A synthetase/AMP-(fatty) acid ligase
VPEAFIAAWAGTAAGIANPINPFLRSDHVAAIMNAAGTTVLVCGGEALDKVNELRSRVPTLRAVRVLDSMPLTAVGKIFKPQLRLDATRRCVHSVMAGFGVSERVEAQVRESSGGFCVFVRSADALEAAVIDQIRTVLERYTFKVEIEAPSR